MSNYNKQFGAQNKGTSFLSGMNFIDFNSVMDSAADFIDDTKENIEELGDTAAQKLDAAGDAIVQFGNDAKEAITDFGNAALEKANQAGEAIGEFGEQVKTDFNEGVDNIKTFFTSSADGTKVKLFDFHPKRKGEFYLEDYTNLDYSAYAQFYDSDEIVDYLEDLTVNTSYQIYQNQQTIDFYQRLLDAQHSDGELNTNEGRIDNHPEIFERWLTEMDEKMHPDWYADPVTYASQIAYLESTRQARMEASCGGIPPSVADEIILIEAEQEYRTIIDGNCSVEKMHRDPDFEVIYNGFKESYDRFKDFEEDSLALYGVGVEEYYYYFIDAQVNGQDIINSLTSANYNMKQGLDLEPYEQIKLSEGFINANIDTKFDYAGNYSFFLDDYGKSYFWNEDYLKETYGVESKEDWELMKKTQFMEESDRELYFYLLNKDPDMAADFLACHEDQINQSIACVKTLDELEESGIISYNKELAEQRLETALAQDPNLNVKAFRNQCRIDTTCYEINTGGAMDVINDYADSLGFGVRDGVIQWGEGIGNAICADGIKSVKDYQRMYMVQILSQGENSRALLNETYQFGVAAGNMLPTVAVGTAVTVATGGNAAAGSAVSKALLVTSAYGNTKEQVMQTYEISRGQAYLYAGASAGLELVMEGKLGSVLPLADKEAASFIEAFVKEGTQEAAQSVLESTMNLTLGEKFDVGNVLAQAVGEGIYGGLVGGTFYGVNHVTSPLVSAGIISNVAKRNNISYVEAKGMYMQYGAEYADSDSKVSFNNYVKTNLAAKSSTVTDINQVSNITNIESEMVDLAEVANISVNNIEDDTIIQTATVENMNSEYDKTFNENEMGKNQTTYTPGQTIEEAITKITAIHNYSDEMKNIITPIYEILVNEFGSSEQAFKALEKNTIYNVNDLNEFFKNKFNLEEYNEFGPLDQGTSSLYTDYDYNPETGEYSIKEFKNLIVMKNLDLSNKDQISQLIHELCHATKGWNINIDGNIVTLKNGFLETKEELRYEDGKVKSEVISEKGRGLEETLNTVLQEKLTKELYNDFEYKVGAYGFLKSMGDQFYSILGDNTSLLLEAQTTNDTTKLAEAIGQENLNRIISITDEAHDLLHRLFSLKQDEIDATKKDLFNRFYSVCNDVITNNNTNLINKYINNFNETKDLEYVFKIISKYAALDGTDINRENIDSSINSIMNELDSESREKLNNSISKASEANPNNTTLKNVLDMIVKSSKSTVNENTDKSVANINIENIDMPALKSSIMNNPKVIEIKNIIEETKQKAESEGKLSIFHFSELTDKLFGCSSAENFEFLYKMLEERDDGSNLPFELVSVIENLAKDNDVFIHRTHLGVDTTQSGISDNVSLVDIMTNGLKNFGHGGMVDYSKSAPDVSLTTTLVTGSGFAGFFNLFNSYKENDTIILGAFPKGMVDSEQTMLVSPDEFYYRNADGEYVFKPEFMKGALIKKDNGSWEYYSQEDFVKLKNGEVSQVNNVQTLESDYEKTLELPVIDEEYEKTEKLPVIDEDYEKTLELPVINEYENVEAIKVSELNTETAGYNRPFNMDCRYRGFDYVYKTNVNNIANVVNDINDNNISGNIVIELENTNGLTNDIINQLPDNAKVLVVGGYNEEVLNSFNGISARVASINTIYTKEELLSINSKLSEIESGIEEGWSDEYKVRYFYDYLKENLNYLNASDSDGKTDGLKGLLTGEATSLGFAHIFNELCNRNGIYSEEIVGTNGIHSQYGYNYVVLDGFSYMVDSARELVDNKDGCLMFGSTLENYRAKNELGSMVDWLKTVTDSPLTDDGFSAHLQALHRESEIDFDQIKNSQEYKNLFEKYSSELDENGKMYVESNFDITSTFVNMMMVNSILTNETVFNRFMNYNNNQSYFESIRPLLYLEAMKIFIESNNYPFSSEVYERYNAVMEKYSPKSVSVLLKEFTPTRFVNNTEINPDFMDSVIFNKDGKLDEFLRLARDRSRDVAINILDPFASFAVAYNNYKNSDNAQILLTKDVEKNLRDLTSLFFINLNRSNTYLNSFSEFGANQAALRNLDLRSREAQDVIKIFKEVFPNMKTREAIKLMNIIDTKGICSYAGGANAILLNFFGQEELFRNYFGFDMYSEVNGKKVLNDHLLLAKMFASINRDNENLIKRTGLRYKVAHDDENQLYMSNGAGFNAGLVNRFFDYYNIPVVCESKVIHFVETPFEKTFTEKEKQYINSQIIKELTDGKQLQMGLHTKNKDVPMEFVLYGVNGVPNHVLGDRHAFGHSVFITGVDANGNILISSWGQNYYLKYEDLGKIDFIINEVSFKNK